MKIGMDFQAISTRNSGLGRYTLQLFETLRKIDERNQYLALEKPGFVGDRTPHRIFWENVLLYGRALASKVDILHVPAFSVPVVRGNWRLIVTVHDLIGMLFPSHLSPISRWYWAKWLPCVNKRADCIIVDSECTRQDMIQHLKVPAEKIKVIHLAAGQSFVNDRTESEVDELCRRLKIRRPYIFFVGNLEPRKNLARVIEAFAKLHNKERIPHQLVIAGAYAWSYEAVSRLTRMHGIGDCVAFPDFVSDRDLVTLYNGADLFVFPSLYEGFGLPILEAMRCGVPVLASNVSSIPEVAGQAVHYVNPYDVDEIEHGIEKVVTDRRLWKDLRERGFAQASQFTWEKTAQKTIEVYESCG